MGVTQIATPHGPAVAETDEADGRPSALLVLGHGAGGGVEAPDLMAVRRAALAAGLSVVRVTQPYRVAGRRAPAPAAQLDAAWSAVVHEIVKGYREPPPLVVGGRSSGARVACRTSVALGAAGIVCLAFPLHPPGRPERSRAEELLTGVPTLVVNGDRDPFGVPDASPGVEVVVRPGQRHDLRGDPRGLGQLVVEWLRGKGWARP
ncbi:alpha/beta family hydrolase [Asanoa sp. NPDC050611]|uniref:alpha/beta hydrolase family protein n=1 Tax=Asanoa sp. NPDC050611 TaxID=3157098 RepID=UPI003403D909